MKKMPLQQDANENLMPRKQTKSKTRDFSNVLWLANNFKLAPRPCNQQKKHSKILVTKQAIYARAN
jgi:hypothetical protein